MASANQFGRKVLIFRWDEGIVGEGFTDGKIVDGMFVKVGTQLYNIGNICEDTKENRNALQELVEKKKKMEADLLKEMMMLQNKFTSWRKG